MPVTPSTITAVTPIASATEGNVASGVFVLSAPLASTTTVNASITGWGATAADYAGFAYTTTVGGVTSGLLSVAPDGSITLPVGTTSFALSTLLLPDAQVENYETIVFVVSQTAASTNIENSWWVTSQINIADAAAPGIPLVPVVPATITAVTALASAAEGSVGTASFALSTPLVGTTTVKATITGWGATNADYSGFAYTTTVGGVTSSLSSVAPDGTISLPSGTTSFTLSTLLVPDGLTESYESLVFVVSQTAATTNITNSWWVSSQLDITDPVGPVIPVIPVTPATITAVAPVASADEGTIGSANFHLSTPLVGSTTVKATITAWGASNADYSGFAYTTTVGGVTSPLSSVAPDGTINLPHGTTDFTLSTALASDALTESYESLVFVVSQTAATTNITNSWWVSSQLNINDPAGAPPVVPPTPATITASTSLATVYEGNDAGASFHLSTPLAAPTTVQASITGWGATSADYTGFTYTTTVGGLTSAPQAVDGSGMINLPLGTTDFRLSTHLNTDALTESYESIVFVVSQTAASTNITNSWWVTSQVNIEDALPPASFTSIAGRDNFVGTAATDTFVINHGMSNADSLTATGGYDIITNFTHGVDKIDLSVTVPSLVDDTAAVAGWTEAQLANAWDRLGANGGGYGGANVHKYVIGSDTYLAVDSNNDGIIQLGDGSASQDVFIKIVGVTNIDINDFV